MIAQLPFSVPSGAAFATGSLAAILPPGRQATLAGVLTDSDIATLKHLLDKGLGANSLRALASDLGYLEAWARAATGGALPWPAPEALLLKFIAQHLWDNDEKAKDGSHGMPDAVATALKEGGFLRISGPHAPATVRRRLASWATLHRWRGVTGPFGEASVKLALRYSTRALNRPAARKSEKALTRDVLEALVGTCWRAASLSDIRDRAILLCAFASGGRRRSEVAHFQFSDLREEASVPTDPSDPVSRKLRCYSLELRRTKTQPAKGQENRVIIAGRAAEALALWLRAAKISEGALFRSLDRWGKISSRGLTPEAVNLIVKKRCRLAGLDAALYSAHGLRSGYLTEASRNRVPLTEAMAQSGHRSVQQAARYYNESERAQTAAVRLLE